MHPFQANVTILPFGKRRLFYDRGYFLLLTFPCAGRDLTGLFFWPAAEDLTFGGAWDSCFLRKDEVGFFASRSVWALVFATPTIC